MFQFFLFDLLQLLNKSLYFNFHSLTFLIVSCLLVNTGGTTQRPLRKTKYQIKL